MRRRSYDIEDDVFGNSTNNPQKQAMHPDADRNLAYAKGWLSTKDRIANPKGFSFYIHDNESKYVHFSWFSRENQTPWGTLVNANTNYATFIGNFEETIKSFFSQCHGWNHELTKPRPPPTIAEKEAIKRRNEVDPDQKERMECAKSEVQHLKKLLNNEFANAV